MKRIDEVLINEIRMVMENKIDDFSKLHKYSKFLVLFKDDIDISKKIEIVKELEDIKQLECIEKHSNINELKEHATRRRIILKCQA